MYDHLLNEQIDRLIKAKFIKDEDRDKAIKVINKVWEDRIAITWSTEDVISCAKEKGKRISKEKAREILAEVLHRHDASIGVNWDVINCYIN